MHEVVDPLRLLKVVLRDHPTHCDSPMYLHIEQHRIQHLSPNVLEVDIDPIREISMRNQACNVTTPSSYITMM